MSPRTKTKPARSIFYPWHVIKPPRKPRAPKCPRPPKPKVTPVVRGQLASLLPLREAPVRLRDPAVSVEDYVSELMMTAARRFPKFDPARGKFSTWLHLIAFGVAHRLRERALVTQRLALNQNPADGFDLFKSLPDPRQHEPWVVAVAREFTDRAPRVTDGPKV